MKLSLKEALRGYLQLCRMGAMTQDTSDKVEAVVLNMQRLGYLDDVDLSKEHTVPPRRVMFNPFTGQPRAPEDVQSDPEGILIVPPGEPLLAAPTDPEEPNDKLLEYWELHPKQIEPEHPLGSRAPRRASHFVVYRGQDNQWYWRLVAGNYQTVAIGGEGYTTHYKAQRAAKSLNATFIRPLPVIDARQPR